MKSQTLVWCDQDWDNHQETHLKGSGDMLNQILKDVVRVWAKVKVCINFCGEPNVCMRQASSIQHFTEFPHNVLMEKR